MSDFNTQLEANFIRHLSKEITKIREDFDALVKQGNERLEIEKAMNEKLDMLDYLDRIKP